MLQISLGVYSCTQLLGVDFLAFLCILNQPIKIDIIDTSIAVYVPSTTTNISPTRALHYQNTPTEILSLVVKT